MIKRLYSRDELDAFLGDFTLNEYLMLDDRGTLYYAGINGFGLLLDDWETESFPRDKVSFPLRVFHDDILEVALYLSQSISRYQDALMQSYKDEATLEARLDQLQKDFNVLAGVQPKVTTVDFEDRVITANRITVT